MRIESVRFDASGNATLVVSGGISFFLPHARIGELGQVPAGPGSRDPWAASMRGDEDDMTAKGAPGDADGRGGFLADIARRELEFDKEDEFYCVLEAIDEDARAKRKAVELCARAEQSSQGLAAKLAAKGFSRRAVKAVMVGLKEEGILDDARYARIWARGRAERRACGPALLAAELRSRGQCEDAVRSALEDIDFSRVLARAAAREHARLEATWARKGLEKDERFRDSLYHILKRQGFDPENIRGEMAKLP